MFFAPSKLIKIKRHNLEHGYIKDWWPYPKKDQDAKPQSGTSSIFRCPNSRLKRRGCCLYFKIKMESQNLELGCIKDQWPYPNPGQDAKPQSGTSSILQSQKSGPKGHEFSLHLHNQDKEGKFGIIAYQTPVTKSKWRSKCQTQVRNLQHHPKPQSRTWRT